MKLDNAPAPERRQQFEVPALRGFVYPFWAPLPYRGGGVGEAERWTVTV
jgi:hypothetical protein